MIKSLIVVPIDKFRSSWALWRSLLLVVGFAFLAGKVAATFDLGPISGQRGYLTFPYVWVNTAWVMRYFNYFFAFLLISFVRRDVDQALTRQALICGWKPWQVVLSYSFVAKIFTLFGTLTLIAVALTYGIQQAEPIFSLITLQIIAAFFLASLALFHIAILLALVTTSAINAAMSLILLNLLIESILGRVLNYFEQGALVDHLPFATIGHVLPSPIFPPFGSTAIDFDLKVVALACIYTVLFWMLSWMKVRLSDH